MDGNSVDRYKTFINIDCFYLACDVFDKLFELTSDETKSNRYFERLKEQLPQNYFERIPDEQVLYLVCSNVFYFEELFEKWDFYEGLEALRRCEFDCC